MRKLSFWLMLGVTFAVVQFLNTFAYDVRAYALVTLPGTFFHELAHYLTAAAMGGHPSNFTLAPTAEALGSVQFYPTAMNAASVGLAPLLLAPLTFVFVARAAQTWSPIWLYLSGCSWVACTPSPQDFTIAASMPTSWPIAVFFLGLTTLSMYIAVSRMVR